MNPTTLISLSGGMDSAYVAWQHLATSHEPLLLHHVNLRHAAEDRLSAEKIAVQSILQFFLNNGLNNFVYYESSFDYGNLPRISIKDIQIVAMFQAIILRTQAFNSINTIKLSWHKGEVNDEETTKGIRIKRLFEALDVPQPDFEFPIENMTRAEMAEKMPPELYMLCRSCRRPHLLNGPCRRCKTCLEFIDAGLPPI